MIRVIFLAKTVFWTQIAISSQNVFVASFNIQNLQPIITKQEIIND